MAMTEALQLLGFFLALSFIQFSSATVVWNEEVACGALELADPLDACTPLRNDNKTDSKRIALIIKSNCSFHQKLENAQSRGFSAAIIYDPEDTSSSSFGYKEQIKSEGIDLLAFSVSKSTGEYLQDGLQNPKGKNEKCCIYMANDRFAIGLISFSVVALVLVMIFLFIETRCVTNHVKVVPS